MFNTSSAHYVFDKNVIDDVISVLITSEIGFKNSLKLFRQLPISESFVSVRKVPNLELLKNECQNGNFGREFSVSLSHLV